MRARGLRSGLEQIRGLQACARPQSRSRNSPRPAMQRIIARAVALDHFERREISQPPASGNPPRDFARTAVMKSRRE